MNWEIILYIAFSAIGIIQYIKGLAPKTPSMVWAFIQPAMCIGLSAVWLLLPTWVAQGVLAFAISQIGYETIIQTIKKKLDSSPGGTV